MSRVNPMSHLKVHRKRPTADVLSLIQALLTACCGDEKQSLCYKGIDLTAVAEEITTAVAQGAFSEYQSQPGGVLYYACIAYAWSYVDSRGRLRSINRAPS